MKSWMKTTLRLAAVYNLVWGLFCILFPEQFFLWADMEPPRYLELWQCIGMIVGVYGIGYWVAANDPLRHWPIVLVGLLGKIFGPIGFGMALWKGTLPIHFGATIITNDLIWWVPFGVILWRAFGEAMDPGPSVDGDGSALDRVVGDDGRTLSEMSSDGPVLTVLLRHAGCVFHRQALADLKAIESELGKTNTQLAVVHMADGCNPLTERSAYHLKTAVAFADPKCELYRELGLTRGSFRQLLGPKVWSQALISLVKGHGIGKLVGDGFQMPGVFLIEDGKVLRSYRHQAAGDRPDYLELAKAFSADRELVGATGID